MAFLQTLERAKSAEKYKVDLLVVEESIQKRTPDNLNQENYFQTFKDIWTLKEETANLKVQIKRQALNQQWKNNLACENVQKSLEDIEHHLDSVIKDKDNCLNVLRNPETASNNSLSLKRDRQSELIDSFERLVKVIGSKQNHISDSSWIANQNWPRYGQELCNLNRKLLQLEASLAKNLQEIKAIKNSTEES